MDFKYEMSVYYNTVFSKMMLAKLKIQFFLFFFSELNISKQMNKTIFTFINSLKFLLNNSQLQRLTLTLEMNFQRR